MKRRQVKKLRKKFNSLQRTIVRTEKCECRCGDSGSGAGGSSALSGCDCGGAGAGAANNYENQQ